jgi:GNAT superfamily N-acetyltransferase
MEAAVLERSVTRPSKTGSAPKIEPDMGSWTSADGTRVLIRSIGASDLELERAFVRGLSRDTSYQRLMSGRFPTEEELRRWTDVDGGREFALIAVVAAKGGDRQVGVARFIIDAVPDEADFAMVLSDDWQGRGLGRQLLSRLIEAARRRGLKRRVGETLSVNTAMLALARKLGFEARMVRGAATVTALSLPLDRTPG